MSARTRGLLVILSLLWGGSFLFVELALRGFPVLTIVWVRVAGAAALLALGLALRGPGFPPRQSWGALLGMGLLNNAVPFTLFVLAQGQITGGLASILNATTPLWTVVAAWLFTAHAPIRGAGLAGLGFGFAGVTVIAGAVQPAGLWAMTACLGAALSYGLAGVWGRRFAGMGLAPVQVAFGMLASATLMLLPLWLAIDRPWQGTRPEPGPMAALAALSLLSTALAYLLYFRILAEAGAVMLSLVTFLIPVSALALGALWLGEPLLPRHLAGLALILAGLAALDGRIGARWSKRRAR